MSAPDAELLLLVASWRRKGPNPCQRGGSVGQRASFATPPASIQTMAWWFPTLKQIERFGRRMSDWLGCRGFGAMSAFEQLRVAKAFGVVLRAVRTHAGISLEHLAELADIDRTYPSLIERGLRQPTIGRVIAIAYALRIEPGNWSP